MFIIYCYIINNISYFDFNKTSDCYAWKYEKNNIAQAPIKYDH